MVLPYDRDKLATSQGRDQPAPARDAAHLSDGNEIDWDGMLAQLASQPLQDGWVTLKEASSATGMAQATLRSWYRSSQVPSRMVMGTHGPQRLVLLEAVVDRALRSSRARRQMEQARALEAEVAALRRRVEAIERHLGIN